MALINNIGAGIYTTLNYVEDSGINLPTSDTAHQNLGAAVTFEGILVDEITDSSDSANISISNLSGTLPASFDLVFDGGPTISVTSHNTVGNVLEIAFTADAANAVAEETVATFSSASGSVTFSTIEDVREFPSFGAPANIVNVPVYGQAVSSQISGQSDAPTLEFTLNYIPSEHSALQDLVQDGNTYVFQIRLRNSDASTADDAVFYVKGSFASFTVAPNLTDSNQATLTLSTSSDYVGPFAS